MMFFGRKKKPLEARRDAADRHYHRGLMCQITGDVPGALREFKKASQLDPRCAAAHASLGTVYRTQGNTQAAIEEYKEAIRLEPSCDTAHYEMGCIHLSQGNLQAAIEECKILERLGSNIRVMLEVNIQEQLDARQKQSGTP